MEKINCVMNCGNSFTIGAIMNNLVMCLGVGPDRKPICAACRTKIIDARNKEKV